MENITTIFWDWNGTLLDDIQICIDSINIMLKERKKELIMPEIYRKIFTFPVKDYYEKAGFDFTVEDFEKPAIEFIDIYTEKLVSAPLFKNTEEVLDYFKQKYFPQYIISAMEQKSLVKSVNNRNIDNYFQKIIGLNNYYAESKIDRAKQLISEISINPETICLIGDTIHDYQVAKEIGCKCVLVANGHQNHKRLKTVNCLIVDKIKDIIGLF